MDDFFRRIESDRELGDRVCYRTVLPGRGAMYAEPSPPLPDELRETLATLGIGRLYNHQAQAIDAVRSGENIVVVTPTASGKSLTYTLPILEKLLTDPGTCALLLFPLKALEQDQRAKLEEWRRLLDKRLPFSVEIYDGDTPQTKRAKIKRHPPNLLISNPDMLHQAILAYHAGWEHMLRRLRYIVIDELHVYRGVFGSHILQVLRRLSRLLAYYGVRPQFICLSATIANPERLAEQLTGHSFHMISESGAPSADKEFALVNAQGSTTAAAAKLFIHALETGYKSIVFSKARVQTEIIHRMVVEMRPKLANRISSYRAGFLSDERRAIERALSAGELQGVISTSALELGIDIGGLDVCILSGYPGSMMSFWQRSGRVGRRDQKSAVVFVAGSDALDQYLAARPEELIGRSLEYALVNTENEEILRAHLPAAAAEIPLMKSDPFFDPDDFLPVLHELEREGALVRSASGQQWFPGRPRPHSGVGLRNVGGTFDIVGKEGHRPIGQISGGAVFRECHDGAVYLHCGEQYFVEELDLEKHRIVVSPVSTPTYTMARSDKQTEILDDREQRTVGGFLLHRGKVRVTETFHSYERRRLYSQELLSVEALELPPQSYVTSGTWIQLPGSLSTVLAGDELHHMGGIHAVEHAAISLIPLLALCDRGDIGGISFTKHKQLPDGAIFFYDGYPGGAGISDHVFREMDQLLDRTLTLIESCACEEGCPSCIQSPKCGSGNKPLDKRAAIRTLRHLLHEAGSPTEWISAPPPIRETHEGSPPEESWQPRELPTGKRVAVFDLETQKSAEEVGGWSAARFMRVAVAAVWDSVEARTFTYDEAHVQELLDHLKRADLIVGYNVRRFDYEVLRGYTFESVQEWPTLDLLEEVQRHARVRLKLDTLCRGTLGAEKSADGLQSIEWFKSGRMDLVTDYCVKDVELTRDLLLFALRHGYLLYDRKNAGRVRIPMAGTFLDWPESRKVEAA